MRLARDILIAMFGSFLKKPGGKKVVAVADIGSGSAGFAVLEVPAKGPAVVQVAERAILPIEKRSAEAAIAAIGGELERVGQKMLTTYATKRPGGGHPEMLLCVIRTPWTRAQAVRESKHFGEDTHIVGGMVSELARVALDQASEIDKKGFLDATVARIELNGYPTKKPEGKRAHDIEVTALVSGCDPGIRAAIEHSLETILPHTPHTLRSGSPAALSGLRENAASHEYVL